MADIRIRDLPDASPAVPTDFVAIDNGTTRKVPIADLVNVGRPLASQAEAEAGVESTKAMTALTTKQAVTSYGLLKDGNLAGLTNTVTARSNLGLGSAATSSTADFATAAQGALADSAVQPSDLATVATTGAYSDLTGTPQLATQADAVAATDNAKTMTALRVGETIDGRSTKIGDANSKTGTIPGRLGNQFDIEEYLTGDGSTANDTAFAELITYMTANPQKVYRSRPGRVFRLTSGGFVLPADITLRMDGATFLLDANLAAGTQFITTGARNDIDILSARVAATRTMFRGFLINGEESLIDLVKFTSDDQQANTGSNLYGAVTIAGSYCDIGRVETENFDQGWLLYGDSAVGINRGTTIRSSRITSYVRGAYVRNVSEASIYDTFAKTRSPNAGPNPGNNALLLAGVEKSVFKNGVLEDAGEHGFRSGGFTDASGGTGTFVPTSRALEISGYHIEGSGQSGFKIFSGLSTQIHQDITVSDVKCVDCGDDGDALAFNDMGFMFQYINGLNASNCSVSSRSNTYGAYDGFFVQGCSQSTLSGCSSFDVQRNGLRISEFSDDVSLDPVSTNSLTVLGFTADTQTGSGIYINYTGTSLIRDLFIADAHVVVCTNGVEFNGTIARFSQKSYCSVLVRGNSGSVFSGATGSNWNTVDLTVFANSATYDPASLADGAGVTTTVTVTGAALGDHAEATFSNSLQGIMLFAWVSAADTVSVRFQNETGGVIDLASGTLRVKVTRM